MLLNVFIISAGKSSILLDVKTWDDETDMQKLEEAVRSVQMEGLMWGACKLEEAVRSSRTLCTECDALSAVLHNWYHASTYIILVTHPKANDLRESLKYIYNLYVEYVVKNPLYTPGTPINVQNVYEVVQSRKGSMLNALAMVNNFYIIISCSLLFSRVCRCLLLLEPQFPDYVDAYLRLADRQLAPLLLLEPQFPEYVDAYLRLAAIAKARNNVPLSIEVICDAVEVDDKNLDALCICLVTWSLKTMTGSRQKI
ncbi:hypothetical protein CTI12_AA419270 [Artemisia annua]|uniref:Trafficking protein particle complex subunit n=1 Tax=Artemisia annua TaxID=35608 RepID=A0A2U1M580_ARTAN|nr:hypothetical protein CTI12_AA419270 [Artemisia annua]